jgi:glucose-1-phosphate thymidylyltransferase
VLDFDNDGTVRRIIEKPKVSQSNYAMTALNFVDGTATEFAKLVEPSARGELEIVALLEAYLQDSNLSVE